MRSRSGSWGSFFPAWTTTRTPEAFSAAISAGLWLDPLKPERMDHFFGAAICIVLTALAIIASVVTAYAMLT